MPKKVKEKKKVIQKPFDFTLCITIFLLLALGIVMVLSASAPSALSEYGNSYHYVIKQVEFAAVGLILMFIISRVDYRIYKRFYKWAYVISIIALASVIFPGIGVQVNGAKRWIDVGFGTFQPSEIAKIGLIIFYAGYLTENKDDLNSFLKGCIKAFCFLIPPVAILYFLQDHLSASVVIVSVSAIMMVMGGVKLKHFAIIGALGGSAAAVRNVGTCYI